MIRDLLFGLSEYVILSLNQMLATANDSDFGYSADVDFEHTDTKKIKHGNLHYVLNPNFHKEFFIVIIKKIGHKTKDL